MFHFSEVQKMFTFQHNFETCVFYSYEFMCFTSEILIYMTMISLLLRPLFFFSFLFVSTVIFRNVCSIGFKQFRVIYIQPSNNTKRTRKSFSSTKHSKYTKLLFIWIRALKESAEKTQKEKEQDFARKLYGCECLTRRIEI